MGEIRSTSKTCSSIWVCRTYPLLYPFTDHQLWQNATTTSAYQASRQTRHGSSFLKPGSRTQVVALQARRVAHRHNKRLSAHIAWHKYSRPSARESLCDVRAVLPFPLDIVRDLSLFPSLHPLYLAVLYPRSQFWCF